MSAFGPKRTSLVALHMSAFGGKADMTVCGCLLSRSLLGVKQTWRCALHMSAFDPKRTSTPSRSAARIGTMLYPKRRGVDGEAARLHQTFGRRGGNVAICGACATAGDARYWIP